MVYNLEIRVDERKHMSTKVDVTHVERLKRSIPLLTKLAHIRMPLLIVFRTVERVRNFLRPRYRIPAYEGKRDLQSPPGFFASQNPIYSCQHF